MASLSSDPSSSSSSSIQILQLDEIERIVQDHAFRTELIAAMAQGFVAFERGDFCAAPIQTLGAPPLAPFVHEDDVDDNLYAAQVCIKSGYFRNHASFVIKVASGGHPWPTNSGLMQVYSQRTGQLQALLLDEGLLTELRTAAVGALAIEYFGGGSIQAIGMVGTGVQARYQLELIQTVTCCRTVVLWGRTKAHVQTLQTELTSKGWAVSSVNQADDLLQQCDVIVTTTSARKPVLGCSLMEDNNHNQPQPRRARLIVAIGSDAPGKQELHPHLVAQAPVKVADCVPQSRHRGEFQYCHPNDDIYSLGHAIQDSTLHRRHQQSSNHNKDDDATDDRLFLVDSSGVSLQDCVIAQMVLDRHTETKNTK